MIDIKTGKDMTRRDFLSCGIAAASTLGIAGSANASVRRGLGARLAANFAGGGGVEPRVPEGWTEVKALHASGSGNFNVSSANGFDYLYYIAKPDNSGTICTTGNGTGGVWYGVVSGKWNGTNIPAPTTEYSTVECINSKVAINGVVTSTSYPIPANLIYGGYAFSGNFAWRGYLGEFVAKLNGVVLADLVPCVKDGAYKFYDTISGTFMGNTYDGYEAL